jgi:hypothetical protein
LSFISRKVSAFSLGYTPITVPQPAQATKVRSCSEKAAYSSLNSLLPQPGHFKLFRMGLPRLALIIGKAARRLYRFAGGGGGLLGGDAGGGGGGTSGGVGGGAGGGRFPAFQSEAAITGDFLP